MSYLLRLRQFINNPEKLDLDKAWIKLNEISQPPILVYGEALALSLLRSDKVAPTDFIKYYKKLLKLNSQSLPTLDTIFQVSPVLLSGEQHLQAKKAFSKKYRLIEEGLQNWLPNYTSKFFESLSFDNELNPIIMINNYIVGFFETILSIDLNVHQNEIPPLPPKLFFLTQTFSKLNDVEMKLATLKTFIEKTLIIQNRDPSETWMLLTIMVAGFEALESTLLYGLTMQPKGVNWEAKELIREAAAVNFIGRRVTQNFTVEDLNLVVNQEIYICPTLIHRSIDQGNTSKNLNSFSFGKGAHTCIGQFITESIINSFFMEWPKYFNQLKLVLPVKYTRDFNLDFTLK